MIKNMKTRLIVDQRKVLLIEQVCDTYRMENFKPERIGNVKEIH